jgi:hypothetical protein
LIQSGKLIRIKEAVISLLLNYSYRLAYCLILYRESDLRTYLLRHKQQDTTEHNKPEYDM